MLTNLPIRHQAEALVQPVPDASSQTQAHTNAAWVNIEGTQTTVASITKDEERIMIQCMGRNWGSMTHA